MPNQPSWEWVDGDPVRASQFGLVSGVLLGAVSTLLVFVALNTLSLAGILAYPTLPTLLLLVLVWSVLGPGLLFSHSFQRRFPVVGRLGISPVGLWMSLPFHGFTVKWWAVTRVGPDWIDVSRVIGSERYRLKTHQAQRLSRILQAR